MAENGSVATFTSAARSFAELVREIPASAWDGPGLGEWDLRSLVGHTSRSLITVSTYLQRSAEREDIATAPTRTFELAVHSLDIAGAADIQCTLPDEVLGEATVLAARIATAIGEGQTLLLLSLTGRTALPPSFSVV